MVTFQKLYVQDTPEVQSLLDTVWEDTYVDCLTPEAMKHFTQNWESLKNLSKEEEQNIAVVGAIIDNNIVGIAVAKKIDDEKAEIKRLYVLPGYQGQGIGRTLLTDILIAFSEIEKVSLLVEKENKPAISFYEKFSFVEQETINKEKNGLPLELKRLEISLG